MGDKKNHKERAPIGDEQFDRLVDSELNETQRRELLCRLDSEPDGWRRCALTFLEAQCWRQAVGERAAAPVAPERASGKSRFRSTSAKVMGTAVAMAACFFAALSLGLFVDHGRLTGVHQASQLAGVEPGGVQKGPAAAQPWQTVTLVGGTRPDGSRRYLRLPAVERASLDAAQLQNLPTGIPPDLLETFKRAGRDVRQSRELVPVRLEDGRRLVIPVDQLDVTGGSPAEYQ